MIEVLQTVTVLTIAVTSVFIIGICVAIPFAGYLKINHTSEQLWACAPLAGAGAIILVCQNLLYLDVRIQYAAILIWVCVVLVAVVSIGKNGYSLANAEVPWKLILTGMGVYAVHGSGLLVSGVSNYYGYGWVDMYNYVSQAQFFLDYPYSSTIDIQEHLRTAQYFKHDRIGQTVLHAFITATAGADAQQTFGATILLGPMLVFYSVFLLSAGWGIERRFAYPAAVIASVFPAIASVHLECFFSQMISMPYLFLWPLAISYMLTRRKLHASVLAGLLFTVTAAIYTELITALVMITGIVSFATYCFQEGNGPTLKLKALKQNYFSRNPLFLILSLLCMFAVGVCANIGYIKGAIFVMKRATASDSSALGIIYPWAFSLEGLARLWIGHQRPLYSALLKYIAAGASVLVILAALFFLLSRCRKTMTTGKLFTVLIMCMPLAPLFLELLGKLTIEKNYHYPFFKLLLTIWPLIIFFSVCGIAEWLSIRRNGKAFIYFQIAFVCMSLGITNRIAYASIKPETVRSSARGGAYLLNDDNFIKMRAALSQLKEKRIYIWWYDNEMYAGSWRGKWLAYYARKNIVWSMNPSSESGAGNAGMGSLGDTKIKWPVIGISWKNVSAVGIKEKLGSFLSGTDTFWLYSLSNEADIRRLDLASRTIASRSMVLRVDKNTDAQTWYPIWISGAPGNASLVTVKFDKSVVRFRYDKWGVPAVIMTPGAACSGNKLEVSVSVRIGSTWKMAITCNDALVEAETVLNDIRMDDPLGVNSITDTLEGKYPLATRFPGELTEVPSSDRD
ncbi:hypothetical protein F6R98_19150 [Candidatus Methylospira mobilis]|uniref:Glycosyltransferase RgtA/B/C/D-like domain-containing protein n=1 Tax=Candidatus Methylospira mobilis TaxID=1808979 RepID=A0A5Q0BKW6_9GAMM|nr:hypothetical protein [Candidatus Methylospira mobilis]QFY44483.1 hypothetical protein F6R98_19150 [Candidatus Methylospira mobilis]